MKHPPLSPLSALHHLLLASWVLLVVWLGIEWLLPGSISVEVPVLVVTGIVLFFTLLLGPLLRPARSRSIASIAFLLPLGVAAAGMCAFVLREPSSLIQLAVLLAFGCIGCAVVIQVLPETT